ncbi:hypothetical protein NUW58_g6128 [Xylaria curta]|uniref:Uncharacterized protein n=1 Tax=Xylaria curta TaxID=42375 RepID=A0ACC1NZ47_9PEZI|nr:hypothetical protein NUW58_g6128 [Xylaria curta]
MANPLNVKLVQDKTTGEYELFLSEFDENSLPLEANLVTPATATATATPTPTPESAPNTGTSKDDTSKSDAGESDAGESDAGESDAGESDAGESDAGKSDTSKDDTRSGSLALELQRMKMRISSIETGASANAAKDVLLDLEKRKIYDNFIKTNSLPLKAETSAFDEDFAYGAFDEDSSDDAMKEDSEGNSEEDNEKKAESGTAPSDLILNEDAEMGDIETEDMEMENIETEDGDGTVEDIYHQNVGRQI